MGVARHAPVRVAALVAGLLAALAPACASDDADTAPPTAKETGAAPERRPVVAGLEVSVPRGWQLRRRGEHSVTPAFCFEVSSGRREGPVRFEASGVGPDEAEIRVVELSGAGQLGEGQPADFSLSDLAPPGAVQWTKGGIVTFSSRRRMIYVGIALGSDVSAATKRRVTAVVRSLRVVDSAARC